MQIIQGDLIRSTCASTSRRSVTSRSPASPTGNEPDTGEVNYCAIFRELDRLWYAGWVGCEYRPAESGPGGTSAGLGWLRRI